jgi:hypothetical protein
MVFRPNYNRDRSERDRAARARSDEKQRRKDEKTAQRKAEREGTGVPPAAEAPSVTEAPGEEESARRSGPVSE